MCILSLCLLLSASVYAFAAAPYDYDEGTKIVVSVPEKHEITTHFSHGVMLYMDGSADYSAEVDRLSAHTFTMDRFDEDGREIKSVILNGEDITEEIFGDGYTVPSVYEDLDFSIIYVDEDATTATTAETPPADTTPAETAATTPTDTKPADTTAITTSADTKPTETTAAPETSAETASTAPADNNPDTGVKVQAPFGIGIFFIASALGVYLLRKKE